MEFGLRSEEILFMEYPGSLMDASADKNLRKGVLLQIVGLKTQFVTNAGTVRAVDGLDLTLAAGSTLGIVGESGCGKSVTALSILRLLPKPSGKIVAGEILFNGTDLLRLKEKEMRRIRGSRISMIFQEPMTCLNPVYRIGDQIAETLVYHQKIRKRNAMDITLDLLRKVRIPSPEHRMKDYPHQLSGGMRQRAMIAMAIACNPSLIIADEPTTALDVTVQAQILDLMRQIKKEIDSSIILITHDLGIVAENAENIAVMYAGKVVEYTDVRRLFTNPLHPYTIGLTKCHPSLGGSSGRKSRLRVIPGIVPNLVNLPKGCTFAERCFKAEAMCHESEPQLIEIEEGHLVRCMQYC